MIGNQSISKQVSLVVYPDLEALSRAAAERFVEQARQAVASRGRLSVALAGGRTPLCTYELLAEPPSRDPVPWDRVHVLWGDERCVPADDPRSNFRLSPQVVLALGIRVKQPGELPTGEGIELVARH